ILDRVVLDDATEERSVRPAPDSGHFGRRRRDPPRIAAAEQMISAHDRPEVVSHQNQARGLPSAACIDRIPFKDLVHEAGRKRDRGAGRIHGGNGVWLMSGIWWRNFRGPP